LLLKGHSISNSAIRGDFDTGCGTHIPFETFDTRHVLEVDLDLNLKSRVLRCEVTWEHCQLTGGSERELAWNRGVE
jgi:hypothetical protein